MAMTVGWALSLIFEAWLVVVLIRKRRYAEMPVFAASVFIYAAIEVTLLGMMFTRRGLMPMYAFRQIASVLLRSWVIFDICRRAVNSSAKYKALTALFLLLSTGVLIVAGYPLFEANYKAGTATTYQSLGVYLRTGYLTQVGVIAVLLLIRLSRNLSVRMRDVGIATGLAASGAAELVNLSFRVPQHPNENMTFAILNSLGMVTAYVLWILFVKAPETTEEQNERELRQLRQVMRTVSPQH